MTKVDEYGFSERRLVQNEIVFRQLNHKVEKGIQEINRLAREENQLEFQVTPTAKSMPLLFYCECADEKCTDRIAINLHAYQKHHEDPSCFVVVPGHQVKEVEEVIVREPNYYIVRKYIKPPIDADALHPTPLHNK